MDDYRVINGIWWDERAPVHAASVGYGLSQFVADPEHISDVVRFDLPRLGDVRGLRGVHLQCHIGTDTVSLARLGARMTGLDMSEPALVEARCLALAEARTDGLLALEYTYFERPEPDVFEDEGTYVPTDIPIVSTRNVSWNHGLGEIITALMDAGMQLTLLEEHDSVPWEAIPGQMEEIIPNEWRIIVRPWRVPHSYTLGAIRER